MAAARVASPEVIGSVAVALRSGGPSVLLLGGAALGEAGLRAASRIERATGARLLAETFPARLRRGAGIPAVERLGYRGEEVSAQLRGTQHLILAGAREPVAAFAYPGEASALTPTGALVHLLAGDSGTDVVDALVRLADTVAAGVDPVPATPAPPALPSGALTARTWVQVVGALLPREAIVCDESITAGMATLDAATAGAAAHDMLTLTGLAIGQGLPVAIGAAVACPQRPVVGLQADGSAMYTISALWTQAREQLDITTVLLNNQSYAILRTELDRVGATGSSAAARLLDLSHPDIDFSALATGMGVPATRATTAEQLAEQFAVALSKPGPHLIEAMLTPDG